MKYFTIITLLSLVFSYIDQPCNAGKLGNGVCVKSDSSLFMESKKALHMLILEVLQDGLVQMILLMLFVV